MSKPVVRRRQLLSSEGVLRIVRAIQAADPTRVLTWTDIQGIAREHAGNGYIWTRQALERHAAIKHAYLAHEAMRKKQAKKGASAGRRLSEPQRIARLENEIEELRKTLGSYDERFSTYLVNAIAHGMTIQQLTSPLERPSRGGGNSDAT